MNPYATYPAHTSRWLATLAASLVVLAIAYHRAPGPARHWALPPTAVALAHGERGSFAQLLTADNQLVLLTSEPLVGPGATGLHPASAWHPVALWLTAGGSPGEPAAPLPEAGWPLATMQADGLGAGQPQGALATRRLASAARTLRAE